MGTEKNQRKVLITGAGGFVGFALAKSFVDQGYKVSSLSRSSYEKLEELGVQQFQGDLSDPDQIETAIKDQEIIIHSAALAGFWGPYRSYYKSNTIGTVNLLELGQKHGVKSFVNISSASTVFDGKSIENGGADLPYPATVHSAYAHTKALAEQAVILANDPDFKTISLRPHIILGPGDQHLIPRLINRAKANRLPIIGKGQNWIDIVHVDNLVLACVLAIEGLDSGNPIDGRCYYITNGEPVKLWDFIHDLLKGLGYPKPQTKIPYPLALVLAKVLSGTYRFIGTQKEPLLTPFLVKELGQSHWFDPKPAEQELGYMPKISSKKTLELLIEHYKNEYQHESNTRLLPR